jgi:hypothetical protein
MRPFKNAYYRTSRLYVRILLSVDGETTCNTRFPLLRFRSALHCGYSVSLVFKMTYFLS